MPQPLNALRVVLLAFVIVTECSCVQYMYLHTYDNTVPTVWGLTPIIKTTGFSVDYNMVSKLGSSMSMEDLCVT